MTKGTYKDAVNKKKIRDRIFTSIKPKKVIGLGGPDIQEYNQYFKQLGVKKVVSYEMEYGVFIHQLKQNPSTKLVFANINESRIDNSYFYDLDYCCTIKNVNFDFINKIDNYLLTLSLRGVSKEQTLNEYFSKINHKFTIGDFKTGFISTYRDTSPMITILKIKK